MSVDPPPPENFLDVAFTGRLDNLTDGKVPDDVAREWVLADLRRSMGDLYASHWLREDIANANVFGPPGLNGTSDFIARMRARGVERIDAPMMGDILAAALLPVSKDIQEQNRHLGLTDHVVVFVFRPKVADVVLVYEDGRNEVQGHGRPGDLHWQLDAGYFYDHPTLGPLWYQTRGWPCRPDATVLGKLCGQVKP